MSTKTCNRCKCNHELNMFKKDRSKKDGLHTLCSNCVKDYKIKNKDKIKAYKKEYRSRPEVKVLENAAQKKRRTENDFILREKRRAKRKQKLEQGFVFKVYKHKKNYRDAEYRARARIQEMYKRLFCPEYRIKKNLRIRLNKALKGKLKKSSAFRDLGMDMETFMKHLETLFYGEMTWDNYGIYWDLDHIIPLDSFDLTKEEDFKKASHHSNIQPLTKTHNSIKKNRILTKEQNELLKLGLLDLKDVA